MLRSAVALGALLIGVSAATAAERPPQLNLEPTCSVAAGVVSGRTRESCMTDENTARGALNDKWKTFSATQQRRCTDLVHMGGPPSYVELLTCLEMAEQAKKIPDRDLLNRPAGQKLVD